MASESPFLEELWERRAREERAELEADDRSLETYLYLREKLETRAHKDKLLAELLNDLDRSICVLQKHSLMKHIRKTLKMPMSPAGACFFSLCPTFAT